MSPLYFAGQFFYEIRVHSVRCIPKCLWIASGYLAVATAATSILLTISAGGDMIDFTSGRNSDGMIVAFHAYTGKRVTKHRVSALGLLPRGLVLNDIPVLDQNPVL